MSFIEETCTDESSEAPSTPPTEMKKGKKKDKCQQVKDKPEDKRCKQQQLQQQKETPKKVNRTEWFEKAMVLEKPGDPLRMAEVSLTRQVYGVNTVKK